MSDGLKFIISADDSQYRQTLERVRHSTERLATDVETQGDRMGGAFTRAATGAAALFSIAQAQAFVGAVIEVRSKIESMATAFEVFLGSQERSAEAMRTLQDIAASSPLTLEGLGASLQTLLGFNVEGERAIPILRQLGDISGGDSERLKSLALAFAQASSTGRLMGQDLLQMINAGFNPLVEISRTTGRSMAQLKDEMSRGLITIDMLEGALHSATAEGGKFYGMLKKQGQTLQGARAQLSGAIDDMYNKIGQSNQDLIQGGYKLATSLVSNYETIGSALASLIAIVGLHKAAIIARNAIETGGARLKAITTARAEALALEQVTTAEMRATLSKQGLVAGTHAYNLALKQEIATQLQATRAKLASQTTGAGLLATNETLALQSKAHTLQSALNTASINANTAAKSLNSKITAALTASIARLKAAMASNVWTLAAVAIAAVGYALYKLITYQTESERAQTALNEAIERGQTSIRSERGEVDILFDALKRAEQGTQEWHEAREAIQSKYGTILANQREEVRNLNDIAEAQRLVTAEIERTARTRAISNARQTALDSYAEREAEARKNILNKLTNEYGEGEGRKVAEQIFKAIDQGARSIDFYQGINNDKVGQDVRDKIRGAGRFDARSIYDSLADITEAKDDLRKGLEDIKTLWGEAIAPQAVGAGAVKTLENIGEATEQTRTKIQELKEQIEGLRAGKIESSNYTEDIDKAVQELKRQEERLATLTGVKPTTSAKSRLRDLNKEKEQRAARERYAKEQQRERIDLAHALEELEISLMKQGEARTLAELSLKHQRELETLRRQKEDYLQAKREREAQLFAKEKSGVGRVFDPESVQLTDQEQAMFDRQSTYINSRQAQELAQHHEAQRRAMAQYLSEWGDYQEQRLAIAELYALKIAEATTEGERLALEREQQSKIAQIDAVANQSTDAIARLFGDMRARTASDMNAIAEEARQALDYINEGIYRTDHEGKPLFGITEERMNTIRKSASEVKAIADQVGQVEQKAIEASSALGKMGSALSIILKTKRGTDAARSALGTLGKGFSELQGQIGLVGNAISSLGKITGSNLFSNMASGLSRVMDVAGSVLQGFQSGGAVGAAVAGVTAAIGAISEAVDAAHERKIQALQRQIETLRQSFDQLDKQIAKSFSSDSVALIEQQIENMREQRRLIDLQIREEADKKEPNTQPLIDEYNRLADKIAEHKERAVDAIFGQDVRSAINDFANAYTEAFSGGSNRTQALTQQARDMMKRMIMEQIKALASPDVERLRKKIREFWADGVFTREEQERIEQMAQEAQSRLDAFASRGVHERLLRGEQSTGVEASRRGFEAMGQQTAEELNGRFTAIQQSVLGIASMMDDMRRLGALSNGYLDDISRSNRQLYKMNERLAEIERNTKSLR